MIRHTTAMACLVLAATTVRGQDPVWEVAGIPGTTRLGSLTSVLGDVDGDGYRELLTLIGVFDPVRRFASWHLGVLSGRDGSLLRLRPRSDRDSFRVFGPAGDSNGDGTSDYVVTVSDDLGISPTLVQVCSGRDDQVLWQVSNTWLSGFGTSVLGNLDLDGDGRPDVVTTAPSESNHDGAVYAYAHGGRLLYRIAGTPQRPIGARFTYDLLGRMGDVDGDGADDFVVGGADRIVGSGAAFVVSGRTGRILVAGLDQVPNEGMGVSVDGCGDVDRDGVPDFVTCNSPQSSTQDVVVRVYSGRTGGPIRTWTTSTQGPCLGPWLSSRGIDLDLDGVPDVLNGGSSVGSLSGLSGRDGTEIFSQCGLGGAFGVQTIPIGVEPPSRFPRFATIQPDYQWVGGPLPYRGRILVYTAAPPTGELFGIPCFNGLPRAPRIGLRDLGTNGGVRVTVHDGPPGPAALLIGLSRTSFGGLVLPYPLVGFGMPGCSLYTSVELALVTDLGSSGLDRGYAAFQLPLFPRLHNVPLYLQWWCQGLGSPTAMSEAATFRF